MTISLARRQRARDQTTDQQASTGVPAVLPVVTMTVQADATLQVVVDGEPFGPPTFAPPWQRHSFAQIINEAITQRHSPVRVIVHELDGTIYTDIVTAPLHRARGPSSPPGQSPASEEDGVPALDASGSSHPLTLRHGEGFVPGEEVAVAVIVRHIEADREGAAQAAIEPGLLNLSPAREVILLGRVSGTCLVGHPS